MINRRNITQTIFQAVGQIIGLAIALGAAVCLLLLMPGMAAVSLFIELTGSSISTLLLWVLSLVFSLGIYFSIRTLIKDPDRSWNVYGGICIAVLILSIIFSVGFQLHFGQRCARRFLGLSELPKPLSLIKTNENQMSAFTLTKQPPRLTPQA